RVEDALCARGGHPLAALPAGARVGTSSLRRTAQLRALRSDLSFEPLRGNVPTRLDRIARGELDAVVLAVAGLERLGLLDRATEIFFVERVLPAPAQGAIAVQVRAGDEPLRRALSAIDHAPSRHAVEAERTVPHERASLARRGHTRRKRRWPAGRGASPPWHAAGRVSDDRRDAAARPRASSASGRRAREIRLADRLEHEGGDGLDGSARRAPLA